MPTIESKLIDIEATLLDERERSYWLDDGKTKAWVAKSLVENHGDGWWTMPVWLAKEKGLV
jgi:hypothetical protein